MEEHVVKILSTEHVTHDVKRFKIEKPEGYSFIPGQATEVAINTPGWTNRRRPFTFTSLNKWPELEFTIKGYPDKHGVTDYLHKLQPGDELLIHDVWGTIHYKGPGVFIAGGAGVTPFISIFRQLHEDNKLAGNSLVFANKTAGDIILKDEFEKMLGPNFHNILSQDTAPGYASGRIKEKYLLDTIKDFTQHFYVCGPDQFVVDIKQMLANLGAHADAVVFEQ